jgi:hypothetical protein
MVEATKAFDEMDYQQTTDTPVDAEAVLEATLSGCSSSDKEMTPNPKDKMIAPGVTGAVVGFFLGGPIGSALVGFTAAYLSQKADGAGDAARALGDVGLTVRAKAMEVDEKHKIVDNTAKTAADVWERAKELDKKNQVLEYSKGFVVHSWQSLVQFVQEHRLLEKGVDTAGKGYEFVAEKLCRPSESTNNSAK